MFFYNCLVWFSHQNRHQKTTTDSQDCWEDYQELYTSRVRKRAKKVTLDPSHPAHSLFVLLPSGRRYRSLSTKTARHKNSFSPRPYPTWTTHNTPRYCTSVNNSSNLHLYIGHMHIHSSVYGHFSFCIFLFLITIVILNYCLFSSLLVFFITLIICCLCLHCCLFVLSVLEAPNTKTNSLCVQTHLAIKLFLILILILIINVTIYIYINFYRFYRLIFIGL